MTEHVKTSPSVSVRYAATGASFNNTPLSKSGFWADWTVPPQWNLCNAPGAEDPRVARSKGARRQAG